MADVSGHETGRPTPPSGSGMSRARRTPRTAPLRGDDELPEGLGFEFIEAVLPSSEKPFSVVGACKAQPLLASAELANAYRLPLALNGALGESGKVEAANVPYEDGPLFLVSTG
jgi:hypothetical protein